MNNQHAQVFMLVANHQRFRMTQCLDLIKLLKTDSGSLPGRVLAWKNKINKK